MVRFIFVLIFALSVSPALAEVREFIKEQSAVIPAHESQEKVIRYTTQSITRLAVEEAGVFIRSISQVANGSLTNDLITSVTGSVAEVTVLETEVYLVGKQPYVRVKVRVKIDTEVVDTYLKRSLEDSLYKKEVTTLNKKNMELEQKLKKTWDEKEGEELNMEAEKFAAEQRKRSEELNRKARDADIASKNADTPQLLEQEDDTSVWISVGAGFFGTSGKNYYPDNPITFDISLGGTFNKYIGMELGVSGGQGEIRYSGHRKNNKESLVKNDLKLFVLAKYPLYSTEYFNLAPYIAGGPVFTMFDSKSDYGYSHTGYGAAAKAGLHMSVKLFLVDVGFEYLFSISPGDYGTDIDTSYYAGYIKAGVIF